MCSLKNTMGHCPNNDNLFKTLSSYVPPKGAPNGFFHCSEQVTTIPHATTMEEKTFFLFSNQILTMPLTSIYAVKDFNWELFRTSLK